MTETRSTEYDYVPGYHPISEDTLVVATRRWARGERTHSFHGPIDDFCEVCSLPRENQRHYGETPVVTFPVGTGRRW